MKNKEVSNDALTDNYEVENGVLDNVSNCDHKWTTLRKDIISCGKCGKHKEDIFPKEKVTAKLKK